MTAFTAKKRRRLLIVVFIAIMLPLLINTRVLLQRKAKGHHEKIGFHQAVYDKEGKLLPWTSWENALKKEMNWYYHAPTGKSGYPVYFYATFIDSGYKPYKNEIIPCTQLGMGIVSYL